MRAVGKAAFLHALASASQALNQRLLLRQTAQESHDKVLRLLRLLDGMPLASPIASTLHRLTFSDRPTQVGGVRLSQGLILAAGLVKGDGFADERQALRAASDRRRNIMPGWRIMPALVGPVEFGSFTRYPRLGNPGEVVWRREETRSTQNRVGLRNPGAMAAARFLGDRRHKLPQAFGINIAVSPGVEDSDQQRREVVEALSFFLDAGVHPSWFTLNLSCPNTEDDPQGYQLEAETRQLCGAFIARLDDNQVAIPLWVKVGPGLAADQYQKLMPVFHQVGVKAVIATNTLAKPSPADEGVQAGVGGGDLFREARDAVRHLLAEKNRRDYTVDVIACGGIIDGAGLREYERLGVKVGQYWSALVFRGPFAAAIIENELANHDYEYEAVQRESLA